jgi:predicted molibdopterin-dependent oxidoreductase YjgC
MVDVKLEEKAVPAPSATRLFGWQRGRGVQILVDGSPVAAHEGEMLAAALLAAGIVRLRHSPQGHTPRGAFCLMGVCQECLVRIHGQTRQACLVPVSDGLTIELVSPYEQRP